MVGRRSSGVHTQGCDSNEAACHRWGRVLRRDGRVVIVERGVSTTIRGPSPWLNDATSKTESITDGKRGFAGRPSKQPGRRVAVERRRQFPDAGNVLVSAAEDERVLEDSGMLMLSRRASRPPEERSFLGSRVSREGFPGVVARSDCGNCIILGQFAVGDGVGQVCVDSEEAEQHLGAVGFTDWTWLDTPVQDGLDRRQSGRRRSTSGTGQDRRWRTVLRIGRARACVAPMG